MTRQLTTNVESRVVATIVCMLMSLLIFNSLRAAELPSAPVVDEAVWGIYSRLIGTSAQAKGSYILRWSWTKPNEELLEECVAASSGKTIATMFVKPGSKAGEFRASRSSVGGKIWNGTRQPDGSIVYIGEGLLKNPYGVSVDNDGVFQYHGVTLHGNVASIEPAKQSERYLPFAPIAASTSTPQTAPSKSLSQADVESVAWGPLAQLVGHDWIGAYILSFRWSKPGEEMQATWSDQRGYRLLDMVFSRGSKLGLLNLKIPEGDYKGEYAGKISDGDLYLKQSVFRRAEAFEFRMIEPGIVNWHGPLIGSYDGQLAYLNEPVTTAPDHSLWGAFLDLVDRTWLLQESAKGVGSMYKYQWLVRGKVLVENIYDVAGNTTPRWIRHISVTPNGKLRAVRSEGAYLFEAEGIVGPDGGIEFKQLKKSLFSAPWAYRVEAGRLIMPEKLNAITASTPVFVAISAAKEKELEVEYDQQRLAEAHRKREQSQKWTQMLEGASTALGATNQALSEVQRETQVQAAADRQRAMEAESERAASLARQTAIANDAAAQRATQQREDQQRAANAQAAREKTAAASARPTTIASSQSSAPTLPVPNAADAASVEPKYAITPSTYTPSELKSNCWVVDAPSKVATGFSRNSEQDARDEAMTNTKRCKTVSEMVCDMGRDFDSVKDGKYVNVKPFWTCHIGYHCGETQKKCEIKPTAGSKQ